MVQGTGRTLPGRIAAEIRPGHDITAILRCLEGVRGVHVGLASCKGEGRKEMLASMPRREEGTEGVESVNIDSNIRG